MSAGTFPTTELTELQEDRLWALEQRGPQAVKVIGWVAELGAPIVLVPGNNVNAGTFYVARDGRMGRITTDA